MKCACGVGAVRRFVGLVDGEWHDRDECRVKRTVVIKRPRALDEPTPEPPEAE